MNNSYFSTVSNDYSFEYASSTIPTYYHSPLFTPCPVHSSYLYYPSMNTPPATYSYYQQQPTLGSSPDIEQNVSIPTNIIDHTPLRRHNCFKKNQLEILHQVYIRNTHPSIETVQELTVQLNASMEKIRQWFKNRRHSDKKKSQLST